MQRELHSFTTPETTQYNQGQDSDFPARRRPPTEPEDGIDTHIENQSATTNFGTEVSLRIGEGNNGTNDIYRSLIKFDLSSIPANATITSATLSLWTANGVSDNVRTIRVYRLKVPFAEGEATWNESASGVNWQSAGASGANDRESTEIGFVLVLCLA